MRTFFISLMAIFLITLPVAETVEAKRLGGGFSLGKKFSAPKKATPPAQQKQAAPNAAQQATKAAPKRKGFGGLMAGLLAGGIFGALLFGGAFDGIQFMDLLLIAAVIFIIYKIMSARKAAQPQPAYADQGAQRYEINPHHEQNQAREAQQDFKPMPSFGSNLGGNGWGDSQEINVPQWFNKDAFVEGARGHFIKLQAAWDNCDWDEIKSYTAAELFELLQQERAKLPEHQRTEVVSVMAEIANFIEEPQEAIVSVNFYGWLKEDTDETVEFNETWHLSRDMSQDNADWFIVGIEQN